ncbi:protein-L-isoaspartate O-methyltransferase [Devosia albogilva]|uniref:Protein-L-isoaspartate O-methyltransferase n=1 Tax=Devosia albogilva TaxID=429726 RepID=A0ABW5QPY8_9HYPH
MFDFQRARTFMVDNQLRTSGVSDWRILARMGEVPREEFLPEAKRELAYLDSVQWLGEPRRGRFMPAPAIFAKLLQLAEIGSQDTVLIVGANSGYSTAVVAGLCSKVTGLEHDAALAESARDTLEKLGISNATIIAGDISALGKDRYDAIFVEGAVETVPQALLDRLSDIGRLVALVREGGVSVATVYVKSDGVVASRQEFNASLPALMVKSGEPEFVF